MVDTLIYPHIVDIRRPNVATAFGKQAYGGLLPTNETIIFKAINAAIQLNSAGRTLLTNLPGDARHQVEYRIDLPFPGPASFATVHIRDIIVDEQLQRYQLFAAIWTAFGFNLRATLMEV
jgi:hypothetical protein